MTFAELDQDASEIPEPVLLVRRLLVPDRLANKAELEPQPVLGRLGDSRDVATTDLYAADELVQRVLVRVGRLGLVPDALVVLG